MNRETKDRIKALPIVRSLYAALMRYKDRQYQKFLKKRNISLKTNGEQVVAAIERLLAGEGITYFYDYGSLLGLVREGHFLGHDTDMDISCNVKDEAAFADVAAILDKTLIPAGFEKKHDIYMGTHLLECTYMYMGVSIGFLANVVTEEESCFTARRESNIQTEMRPPCGYPKNHRLRKRCRIPLAAAGAYPLERRGGAGRGIWQGLAGAQSGLERYCRRPSLL